MQHDQIIVSLPFIEKNWLRQNRIKYKKIGFNFTNLMLFVFREQNNLKDSKELETLVEKNGQQWLINESLHCAAVAYCQSEKIAENFTKDTLIRAIILADQQTQQKIMKCWELSQTFGASFKKKSSKSDDQDEMTYSEEYEFCIGKVSLSKAEYFALTPAETYTKVIGYIFNNERQASYIRNLFHLQFNQWSKQKVSAKKLWPLPEIDNIEELDEEEMYERNKKLIDAFQKMQRQMK